MPGNELTFEANFAQLVFSQLSEKCPALLAHYKGFQLVDKNDEETRAFGVAAAASGKVFLYIPAFFIQGKVRGLDLLYVYHKDLFVPNTDNQINVLIQDGGAVYGKASRKDDPSFMSANSASTYDFRRGLFKGAALQSDNSLINDDAMQKMATVVQEYPPTLLEGLRGFGKQAAVAFMQALANQPDFANSLMGVYSPDELHKLAADLVETTEFQLTPEKDPRQDIYFITDTKEPEARKLTQEQKKLLLQNGVYILDNRKQFSQVYRDKLNTSNLSNPTQPGLYDIIGQDGEFKRFALLQLDSDTLENYPKCYAETRPTRKYVLIDMSSDKVAGIYPANRLFGRPAADADLSEGLRLDKLPKLTVTTFAQLEPGKYAFIADGKTAFEARIERNTTVHVGPENALFSVIRSENPVMDTCTLVVPKGTRYLKLCTNGSDWEKTEKANADTVSAWFLPGTPELFQRNLLKVASEQTLLPIELVAKDNRFNISTAKVKLQGLRKTAAIKHLMYNMGVGQGDSYALLADASAAKGQRRSFLLKVAEEYNDSSALENLRIPEKENTHTDEQGMKPYVMADESLDVAMRASQSGIREVFDTKVLQQLLDVADPAEVRRDYISKLIRSMDATGRLLFQYYWNLDEFIEQYGDDAASELENKLRQLFRETGDLALFLREKTGDFEVMGDVESDISEDIATATESTAE